MSVTTTAADVLQNHVTLTVEAIDRMYLNVIQFRLQAENGIAWFFRQHRGEAFATAKVMAEMTRPFVAVPLAEIAPDAIHPVPRASLAEVAASLSSAARLVPRPDISLQ